MRYAVARRYRSLVKVSPHEFFAAFGFTQDFFCISWSAPIRYVALNCEPTIGLTGSNAVDKIYEQERAIFLDALECESEADLKSYLNDACRGDVELRANVEALLAEHRKSDDLFDAANSLAMAPSDDLAGKQIGHYTLREQIGEGGMGIVYVAEPARFVQRHT